MTRFDRSLMTKHVPSGFVICVGSSPRVASSADHAATAAKTDSAAAEINSVVNPREESRTADRSGYLEQYTLVPLPQHRSVPRTDSDRRAFERGIQAIAVGP